MTTLRMKTITKDHLDIAPEPIAARKNEKVTILKYDSRPEWKGWIQCSLENGKVGWISESYLEINGVEAVFNKDYDAREIEVRVGEPVEFLREDNGRSWIRTVDGREGWVPSQCY